MPLTAPAQDALGFGSRVAAAYATLLARDSADQESGLGGRLFYAGVLDQKGRVLTVAANIAGAATLAASADHAAQKQAVRDGVVDFLVNSLDEALRILKNQLRKCETVAVSVAIEQSAMEREMNERGVAPDLVRSDVDLATQNDELIEVPILQEGVDREAGLAPTPALIVWRTDSGQHKDLALLDQIALACIESEDWAARRWLRLAPRYLGRLTQGLRLLSADRDFAARFDEELKARTVRGEIAFPYEIRSYFRGEQ